MAYKPLTKEQANELFRDWFDAAWGNYHEMSGADARWEYDHILNKVAYKTTHWGLSLTPQQHRQLYN